MKPEKITGLDWDICPRCKGDFINISSDRKKVCLDCHRREVLV